VRVADDPIKDRAQVRLLAQSLWRLARDGGLDPILADVPDWPGRGDEGWILGAGHAAELIGALEQS
jgi:molybdopterin-guanine dinucleotide biosynthesis adapter protein